MLVSFNTGGARTRDRAESVGPGNPGVSTPGNQGWFHDFRFPRFAATNGISAVNLFLVYRMGYQADLEEPKIPKTKPKKAITYA